MNSSKTWFESWFNTQYYHILYKHRDDKEAQFFMQNLVSFFKIPKSHHILDLACGKGRHSIFLNSLGYKVSGVDLSSESIDDANQFKNENLNFYTHDMRDALPEKQDAIFNLFTSFGYFEKDQEDIKVLSNIQEALKSNGVAVLDYLNVDKVVPNLIKEETKEVEGITFYIKRFLKNGFIVKQISFNAEKQDFTFEERVKLLNLEKFKTYANKANLKIKYIFGDYHLNKFEEKSSDRLILIFTK